jgi:hypothetical protein
MEVDQMLHHLNLACGGSQGFYDLPDESYLISRTLFEWILVDWHSEQPVGLRLPTGFKIPHVVIDDANSRMVGKPEVIQRRGGAKSIWTLARLCGSSKNTSAGTSR